MPQKLVKEHPKAYEEMKSDGHCSDVSNNDEMQVLMAGDIDQSSAREIARPEATAFFRKGQWQLA